MAESQQQINDEGRRQYTQHSSFVVSYWPLALLTLALALFLGLSLHQLHLPGFYYDEALDLAPMLQVMHREPVELLRGIGFSLGGYTYPIMLLDYMGSLNGYLTLPFMALLGPGYVAARVQPIFFSAVTIVLAYLLAQAWFGRRVAAVTALLLAVSPSFIWFSRQGISVTSTMTVFSLGSVLLLERWRRRSKWRVSAGNAGSEHTSVSPLPLLVAGILLGLGLWDKLLFLWWIVVVAVLAFVWVMAGRWGAGRAMLYARLGLALRALPWVLGGVLIGAAPLVYYNLYELLRQPFDVRNAHTLALLLKSLLEPTEYGVNNLNLLDNLRKAVIDFNVFLDGSYFWYNGVPFSNVYAVPAFFTSIVLGSLLALRRSEWRRWVGVLAAIVVTVFISAFTVSGLWATHLFIVVPLPQIVLAAAAVWLAEWVAGAVVWRWSSSVESHRTLPWFKGAVLPVVLVVLLLALPYSRDLWVSEQHHAKLAETGGSGRFSDAVYKLAAHLDAQQIHTPVALDWGIEKNVRVLTADRVRPQEVFGFTPEPDEAFAQRVKEALRDPSRQYIVLWDNFAVYNRRKAFTQIANDLGMQVTETFITHERSGLPVYVMLQAK